jgi:hypothetical protein
MTVEIRRGAPWLTSLVAAFVSGAPRAEEPRSAAAEFQGPEACAKCHPRHYLEWRGSAHAYAAIDPIVIACNKKAARETGGRIGTFCAGCHAPAGVRSGEIRGAGDLESASPVARAGVTCEVCHRMEPPAHGKPIANASFELAAGDVVHGTFADPAATPAHASLKSDFIARSDFCGSCHDVIHNGALLEKSFAQWSASVHRERADNCQDCHMLRYSGEAAVGGPFRETLRRHNFPAVSLPLIRFPNRGYQMEEIQAFIRTAARMSVLAPDTVQAGSDLHVTVRVKNSGAGHNLPTGLSNERQMWVEVTVTGEDGSILFRSGHLDGAGDLADGHGGGHAADPALVTFSDRFLDADGHEVPFVFQAVSVDERSLRPLEERSAAYRAPVPASLAGKRARVRVRLLFRSFPPRALRELGLASLAKDLPIWEMDSFDSGPIEVVDRAPRKREHRVPADFESIQAAIDALEDGDRVVVGPGEHRILEPIDFRGKSIHLVSRDGPEVTVLRHAGSAAAASASVVVFRGGEGRGAVLEGFTITGGRGTEVDGFRRGGGIHVARSSPTIVRNRIAGNAAPGGVGGGISVDGGAPDIRDNVVRGSWAELGGGIAVRLPGGRAVLAGNAIEGNRARQGGGLYIEAESHVRLERTLLAGNRAAEGGAVHLAGGASLDASHITIVHGHATSGPGSIAGGGPESVLVRSSILWANGPIPGAGTYTHSFLEQAAGTSPTNRTEFPLFVDPTGVWDDSVGPDREGARGLPGPVLGAGRWIGGDYRLLFGSPAIDGGDPEEPADPDDTRSDAGAFHFEQPLEAFIRGDADGSGAVNALDLAAIAAWPGRGETLPCRDAADLNDDGRVDPLDAAHLAAHLLGRGPPPAAPYPACGLDPTFGEGLSCDAGPNPCRGGPR